MGTIIARTFSTNYEELKIELDLSDLEKIKKLTNCKINKLELIIPKSNQDEKAFLFKDTLSDIIKKNNISVEEIRITFEEKNCNLVCQSLCDALIFKFLLGGILKGAGVKKANFKDVLIFYNTPTFVYSFFINLDIERFNFMANRIKNLTLYYNHNNIIETGIFFANIWKIVANLGFIKNYSGCQENYFVFPSFVIPQQKDLDDALLERFADSTHLLSTIGRAFEK